MEERWRFHAKIHDISTNLGKNILLTPLLCVSLTRNVIFLSLKTRKCNKTVKRFKGKREKAIYMGWVRANSLQASRSRLSELPKNPTMAFERLPRGRYPLTLLNLALSMLEASWERILHFLSGQNSLKRTDLALSELAFSSKRVGLLLFGTFSLKRVWLGLESGFLVIACNFQHDLSRVRHIKPKRQNYNKW